jgi:hypothetical protein
MRTGEVYFLCSVVYGEGQLGDRVKSAGWPGLGSERGE